MPWRRALRLVDVATDQVRSLRARALVAEFQRGTNEGVYLRLGNTVEKVYGTVGGSAPQGETLGADDVAWAASFKTTLRRLKAREFDLLVRHGFEVANATLATRQGSAFSYEARPERGGVQGATG